MKIAIIHDFLTKLGGAERVLHAICDLYPDAPIFTLLYDEKGTCGQFKDKNIVTSNLQNLPAIIRKPKFLLSKYPKAIEEFDLSKYDLVISSSNSFAHGVITKPNTLHLCYCHSPMRYAWDWSHEYLKENNLGYGIKGLYVRSLMHKIRIWDRVSADRVDSWIANSENVKERIKKYYLKDSTVIYPPVSTNDIPLREKKEDFFLVVSRLEPYKKVDLVVETFNKRKDKLVVIGSGSQLSNLKAIANKNIEFLGWQKDEDVYNKMGLAKGYIFSGEEDFGIAPLEAMAAGTPVIAYNKGGVKESVIAGETGLFFDEQSIKSLNSALDRFNETSYDSAKCRKRAEQFSLDEFNRNLTSHIEKEMANK